MRLQVFLSHNGVCSRREAMKVIQLGRVRVNGKIQKEPSFDVDGSEDIKVDGALVAAKSYCYILLHKPVGYTTTKEDVHADKTVLDLLPKDLHFVSPVGRLDKDSEGLLLLTNDGDLAFRLTHPKFHLDKTYIVRVKGQLTKQDQKQLQQGVVIEEQLSGQTVSRKTAPCSIKDLRYNDTISQGSPESEFQMIIHEGRKRQIRQMLWVLGYKVSYLKRISMGPLKLGDLKLGEWRHLSEQEIRQLKQYDYLTEHIQKF